MNNMIIQESAFAAETSITKHNENTIEFIAVIQEADRPNRNGRVYPKSVLEKAIESPYVRERLATKSLYSEAGHPLDSSVQRQMTIDQRNIACIIKEIWWEGNLLKGRIETADTSVGRDMMGLIKQGSKVAFSLRAQGNVHTNPASGVIEVEPGLQICTWDWVVNPSHDRAFLEKICEATAQCMFGMVRPSEMVLTESAELFMNGMTYDVNAAPDTKELDYTKNYTPKLKKYADMYVPAEGDEVISMDLTETVIKSGDVRKRVLTEDYLVKDIRNRISGKGVLDLSESWKDEYTLFLDESENVEINDAYFEELTEATDRVKEGFDAIQEYFTLFEDGNDSLLNKLISNSDDLRGLSNGPDSRDISINRNGKNEVSASAINANISKSRDEVGPNLATALTKSLAGILSIGANSMKDVKGYSPRATYTVQSITDMKFPENLIFFLKQLIGWLKNVVLYFIEKILNVVRRLTGVGEEVKLNRESLKLNLQKARKIEQIGHSIDLGSSNEKIIQGYKVSSDELGVYVPLKEGVLDDLARNAGIIKDEEKLNGKVVVEVNITNDMMRLRELVQHFYDLYDDAYGSNNEDLFGTDDLEAVYKLFKRVMDSMKRGEPMTSLTLGGGAAEISLISTDKVRDNLILTNSNVKALKEAFVGTADAIQDISKIINGKEMLILANSGVDFRMLSSGVIEQMDFILGTIEPRLRDAKRVELGLKKMHKEYSTLSGKLSSMASTLGSYGNVSYSTYYSRQIIDMTNACKYMTDIVTLRLTAVSLYIQELRSVKSCLAMVTGLEGERKMEKGALSKIRGLFKK